MMTPNVQTAIGLSGGLGWNIPMKLSNHRTPDAFQVNATLSGDDPIFFPMTGPTLLSSLFPASSLSEWFKILAARGVFQICRLGWSSVYKYLVDFFFITVDIAQTDPCYNWFMVWLTTQPSWSNLRNIQLGTEFTNVSPGMPVMYMSGNGMMTRVASSNSTENRKLTYKPSHSSSYSFWYKHRYIQINRWDREGTGLYRQKEEFLRLRILSRKHQILTDLLKEAEAAFKDAQENTISIYVSDQQHRMWRHLTTRRKRPLNTIILDPGIKDRLINDAREFLANRDWYAARGIPFRRGYLLYGEPGSGKTSMIQSLAGELELNIYIISISQAGMGDHELNELISRLPEKCIALMEDVDAAFTAQINRDGPEKDPSTGVPQIQKRQKHLSRVTLSGLLNALDGVAAQEGRLLFATTNKYHSLDHALIRPGRMDLHIEFALSSKHQAKELFQRFYAPDGALIAGDSKLSGGGVGELPEKGPLVHAYDTSLDVSEEGTAASQKPHTPPDETKAGSIDPGSSANAPLLSSSRLEKLAIMFSDMLPEREFSMASLQGYLMSYKTEPEQAVQNFTVWFEEERKEKRERLIRAEKDAMVGEVGEETMETAKKCEHVALPKVAAANGER